jgi:hypothetical protein
MKLFEFYGRHDPYQIYIRKKVGLSAAIEVYCKNITFSHVATYTPLMMIEWLMKEYPQKIHPYITTTQRTEYLSIHYSSTVKEYDNIFNHNVAQRAILLAQECINTLPSYVMNKYNIKVLEKYNEGLQSTDLSTHIDTITSYLDFSENLIAIDTMMLEKVFDIDIPNQENLTQKIYDVLSTRINHPDPVTKRKVVNDLNILSYIEKLQPYLQFYYTILELGLESKFTEWLRRFQSSNIYTFYVKNATETERVIRWGQTLLASIIY